MKNLVIILIFLLAAAPMEATEPVTEADRHVQEETVRPVPVTGDEVPEQTEADESWPRPFIPSEKIGADSVVAFPADI